MKKNLPKNQQKKFKFSIFCILLSAFCFLPFATFAQTWPPSGMLGDGTETSPWEIATHQHLAALAAYVNAGNGNNTNGKFYKMTADIDLSSYTNWDPIGNHYLGAYNFRGNFNGDWHIVSNLTITGDNNSRGLFGNIFGNTIQNLGVENCNVSSGNNSGGLVGATGGIANIINCYSTGTVTGNAGNTGGLVGLNSQESNIKQCYSSCNVNGTTSVGGLVGRNIGENTVINCYATGNVSGKEEVGGFVGTFKPSNTNYNNNIISNCYATGKVTNSGSVGKTGGIAGWHTSKLLNCVAVNPEVVNTQNKPDINRIAGYFVIGNFATISNNYAFEDMVVLNAGAPVDLGTIAHNTKAGESKPIAIFKTLEFYTTASNWSTVWDMTTIWDIHEGEGLPFLRWEVNMLKAPVISTTTLPEGKIGTPYSTQLEATGTAPITWSLESSNLPDGLTLSTAGVISGTPTTTGTFSFTVKATNSIGSDTKELSIAITASTVAPTITTTTLPGGVTGTAYSAQLAATGTAPITWTLESGDLPGGLTLSTAGVISGTPTTVGTFSFTIKAENSAGNATKALSIIVEGVGIEELQVTSYELQVYPNPTTGELRVTSDELQVVSIEIFDMMGRKCEILRFARNDAGNSTLGVASTLRLDHLPAGIYFLKIETEKGPVMKKVVKQ
jgi:hypothetical protein